MNAENPNLNATLELEERLRFETLIADLSSKFINLPAGQVDEEIMDAERRICEMLDLDISALWQWSAGPPGSFMLTHYYSAQDGPRPSMQLTETDFPWFRALMLDGRVVPVSSLDDMPPEAAHDRDNCRRLGVKSNLCLPLTVGGVPVGLLGLNTTRAERDWPGALVKRLQLVAQVFANALARKRADQALRESRERLSLTTASAGAGLWSLDCHTGIFWTTEKARKLFGYPVEQVVTMERFIASVDPEDLALVERTLERSLQAGESVNVEYRIQLGNGQTRWIASRGRPYTNVAGEPDRLMGVSIDITERKRNEEALRASEARLAAGTDLAGLGYYEVDYGQRTCFLDDGFREICGVPSNLRQDFEALNFWMEHLHPDDRKLVLEERDKLHHGRVEKTSVEYRYLHPASGQKWIHHLARIAAHSPTGPGIRTFGVLRDITPQKQAELDARELRHNLAHAGRVTLLGQLASSLAHELSQPLGAILRNAEAAEILLQESSPDLEELRAIVEDILHDDQRAGQVIDRLRSLFKRRSLDPQPVELPSIIDEVVSLLHADATARRTKIAHCTAVDLPRVKGDRVHMQQVLLNLIVNAMDAVGESSPDRRNIVVEARQTDPDFVEARVSDNGPGIPAESLARLFEPFFTSKSKGMGMGLPVSKSIIEAHRGRIWAENRADGGACFCFTVPVERGDH